MDIIELGKIFLNEAELKEVEQLILAKISDRLKSNGYQLISNDELERIKKTQVVKPKTKPKSRSFTVAGKPFASVKEFADFCGKSQQTIHNARKNGIDLERYLPSDFTLTPQAVDHEGNIKTIRRKA